MTDDGRRERRQQLTERVERASRLPMVLLSIVFLAAVALPELVELTPELHETLEGVNWLIWAVFAFELGLMTYLAPDRRRYLLEHWVDVLTVLVPFLLSVRLLRIAIVSARLWTEVRVLIYQRTFSTVAMTSLVSAICAATLVYAVERGGEGPIQTYPDALWWAAATVTTVGYGDVFPKTAAGRGIAFLLMLVGISVFGLLTARVAAFFVQENEHEVDHHGQKLDEVLTRLERLEAALKDLTAQPPG
ncbi:MAG: potassium channel family protein [Chloroflexi bacterium]|nr:potassium channel family protein [Chloroflexota bacterium]